MAKYEHDRQDHALNLTEVSFETLLPLRNVLTQLETAPPTLSSTLLSGAYRSKKRGRGIDFDQVRPYQMGDDIRTIDWRITAKTSQAHSKLFFEDRERPIFVIVEQRSPLLFTTTARLKSVMAAQLATMLMGWGYAQHDRTGGVVFNEESAKFVAPRLSQSSVMHFIRYLAEFNQRLTATAMEPQQHEAPQMTLLEALKQSRVMIKPGSLIFFIADERSLNDETENLLTYFSMTSELMLFSLFDPLDHLLPKKEKLTFSQGGQRVTLNGLSEETRQAYHQAANQRINHWNELAKKTQARYCPISTEYPLLQQLLS